FPAPPAMLHRNRPGGGVRGGGAGEFQGENREYGALLTYSLNAPGLPLPDSEKERARKEAERAAARAKAPAGAVKEDQPTKEEVRGRPSAEERGEEGKEKEPKAEIRITDAAGK